MSHFSVMVIGEDIESQLQRYHEFECDGIDDQYVQDVDITVQVRARIDGGEPLDEALSYWGLDDRQVASLDEVDRADRHKYGYAVVQDGRLVAAFDRTNPSKRWDYWVVGGRWSGFFRLKSGVPAVADVARKGDVDFEAMRRERVAERLERYRKFQAIVAGRPVPSWPAFRERYPDDIDAARQAFHADPVTVALDRDFAFEDFDVYDMPEDEFVRRESDRAICTFAVVKDGRWYGRGDMGWWGCVHDEKEPGAWEAEFAALLDGLPDDTLLTVVDCHI
jgi:hypothetical protein